MQRFFKNNSKCISGNMLCLLIVLTIYTVSLSAQKSCFTPSGGYGQCIPIEKCTYVTDLLNKFGSDIPLKEKDELQQSFCGNGKDRFKYVCCDTKYIAPVIPPLNQGYEASLSAKGVSILSTQNCGKTNGNKVANGIETELAEFPWMALIRYDTPEQEFKCGGSLITDRYVLTAAHCVEGLSGTRVIGVRLGEHDLNTELDCKGKGKGRKCSPAVENYGIEEITSHPEYSIAHRTNDVALIKLDRRVEFKKHISPVCLPITEASSKLKAKQKLFVAGWGFTEKGSTSNVLMKAIIPYKNREICQQIFRRTRLTDSHLCAGGEGNVDSCKGDSGGPLFFLAPYLGQPRQVQYGIVSFGGIVCGTDITYPGIYANVVSLMPWITRNIN